MQPPAHILLAEDDDCTRELVSRVMKVLLQELRWPTTLHAVRDGEEAIRYLAGDGHFAERGRFPFPSLIVTDLKMPHADGFAVLEFLNRNPGWHVIPRIVLSSSDDPDDIRTAFQLGASAYHLKPAGVLELSRLFRLLFTYWAETQRCAADEHGRVRPTVHVGKCGERFPIPPVTEQMCRALTPGLARSSRSRNKGTTSSPSDPPFPPAT